MIVLAYLIGQADKNKQKCTGNLVLLESLLDGLLL
jgi:hypothetical protein